MAHLRLIPTPHPNPTTESCMACNHRAPAHQMATVLLDGDTPDTVCADENACVERSAAAGRAQDPWI